MATYEHSLPSLLLTPTASENVMDLDQFKKRMEKYPNGTSMPNLATQSDYYMNKYTSSQGGSLASRSHTLDEEKERMTTAISGQRCFESYNSTSPHGSSLKTCVASLLGTKGWYSKQCALIWKAKVTKYNRLLFQLAPSVRPIGEKGSGLLPTPDANDGNRGPSKTYDPKAKSQSGRTIASAVTSGTGTGAKLRLQPAMTEWMMGFPDKWTELPLVDQGTAKKD